MEDNAIRSAAWERQAVQVQLELFPDEAALVVPPRVRLVLDGWVLAVSGGEIAAWVPLIVAELGRRGLHPRTVQNYSGIARAVTQWLEAQDVREWEQVTERLVTDWCETPSPLGKSRSERPEPGTVRHRETGVLSVFAIAQELGAPIEVRSLLSKRVPFGPRGVGSRPLTRREAELLRRTTNSGLVPTPRSVLVALAFAGGSNLDIAIVRRCDVDLDAKSVRFVGAFERTNRIRGRDARTLRAYLASDTSLGDDDLLCMAGRAKSQNPAASVGTRLHLALKSAGLSTIPGVTARSIRLNGAKRVLKRDGLEAAARYMGATSLDAAAAALRHDWRQTNG